MKKDLERERGFEFMNWLEKATLKFLEIVKGPDHPSVAVCLEKIGKFYFEGGNLEEAEPHFERALKIMEKSMGPNHLYVAMGSNGLAEVYFRQGASLNFPEEEFQRKIAAAESLFIRSLKILEIQLGPFTNEVATTLNGLGRVYAVRGKLDDAERVLKRALDIREANLGPNDLQVALTLNNLGEVYQRMGRNHEANVLLQRANLVLESTLGPDWERYKFR